ncbi:MAG TPA: VWA domain-containing protein [Mycobacteriales bacterium]|nr:VWA domain-containing protein [Mycobacteriales bacterium]
MPEPPGGVGTEAVPRYDGVDSVVGLARTLRAAGVAATPDRVHTAVLALSTLDAASRVDVYWAGRVTLCANHDDLERYDRVFAAYFGDRPSSVSRRRVLTRPQLRLVASGTNPAADEGPEEGGTPTASAAASDVEVLRHRDIATLSGAEREQLRLLLAQLALPGETRRSRRRRPAPRGAVDGGRTVRAWLQAGGEPTRLHHQRAVRRPRRVVLLVDVSGSMDLYADALLRFAHAAARRGQAPTEVFALGTRLSRVTREMRHRDPDQAMTAVAEALPDAGGGTRLGVLLKEFLDRWGQRGLARGAVVVMLSDGWERGEPELLGEQVARLQRLAHRVVWSNPRKAAPGFAPVAGGMAAALPHIDDFLEGHSLAALEHLAAVVLGRAHGPMREPAGRAG